MKLTILCVFLLSIMLNEISGLSSTLKAKQLQDKVITVDDECELVPAAYALCEKLGRDQAFIIFKTWKDNYENKQVNKKFEKKYYNLLQNPSPGLLSKYSWERLDQLLKARIGDSSFPINIMDLRESVLEKNAHNEQYLNDLDRAARKTEAVLMYRKKQLLSLGYEIGNFTIAKILGNKGSVLSELKDKFKALVSDIKESDLEIKNYAKPPSFQDYLKGNVPLFANKQKNENFQLILKQINKSTAGNKKAGEVLKWKNRIISYIQAVKEDPLNILTQTFRYLRDYAIKSLQNGMINDSNRWEAELRAKNPLVIDKYLCRGSSNEDWYESNCAMGKKKRIIK